MKNIIAEKIVHHGQKRIALRFPYDQELIDHIKKVPETRWSQSITCWHIPDDSTVVDNLKGKLSGVATVSFFKSELNLAQRIRLKRESKDTGIKTKHKDSSEKNQLSVQGAEDIRKYRTWMEANRYPLSTIQTYTSMMEKFLRFVSPREASQCTAEDLISLIDEYILPNGLSQSFQNQMISSVKKFYTHICKKAIDPVKITRPRPRHKLPNVLSKDEIKKMLGCLPNEKHRVMLSLIYACGLRRSELINLIPSDLERNRNLLRIVQAKGFKDRVVPVSDRTIEMIDKYISHYQPVRYLFEGQWAGEPYSASSLEKVLKNACHKAGINKPVTLHWLRHSYATHLLELGTDLRYIQELLGHKSSKTTEIYTHVTTQSIQKIRSPFDDL
jgi:integrase/recombinase XerD